MRKLLYATTNPGKIFEVGKFLKQFGVSILSPRDFGLSIDIPEDGQTLEENATLKVRAYLDADADCVVMADDTGVEIDALGGDPGIHARRWRDGKTKMTDQEIIAYCMEKMAGVSRERRGAVMRTLIAVGFQGKVETFSGELRGEILEQPQPLRIEGFPFESLFYIPGWKMSLGEVHQLPSGQKQHFLSHRERAVAKALPRIKWYLSLND